MLKPSRKVIIDSKSGNGNMLYLPLDKLMDRGRDADGSTVTVRPPVAVEAGPERRRRSRQQGGTLMGSRILGNPGGACWRWSLLIASSTFVVREQELAVRVRLSQIVGPDYKPGLQFKIPFMDDVVKFDRRVLTRKFDGEQFLTSESQGLTIDYYIKWRILDAEQFYQATSGGDEGRAEIAGGRQPSRTASRTPSRGRTLKEIVISDRQEITGEFMKTPRERAAEARHPAHRRARAAHRPAGRRRRAACTRA